MSLDRDDEHVNLARLAELVSRRATEIPRDYLPGKTMIRDFVTQELGCSIEFGEELVEQLESRGFVTYSGDTRSVGIPDAGFRVSLNPSPPERR